MQTYELTAFGAPLEPATRATPELGGTEVLLRITSSGVCHSDVHLRDGYYTLGGGKKLPMPRGVATFPHVLGHEIAGVVEAIGPDATGVAVGDRRVAYPWIGCGVCSLCLRGDEQLCTRPRALGITAPGGYAAAVVVPHPRYLLDFGAVPEETACTLACSGLTAYAALKKTLPLAADDRLLICGAGGVGLAAIGLARRVTGVAPVVVELDPAKREAALAAGARLALDPREIESPNAFVKTIGGRLAAAIDFVGAEATASLAFNALTMGGTLVSVGLLGGAFELPLPMVALRAISILGSYVGTLADLRDVLALAESSAFVPVHVETRPMADVGRTLDDLKAGRILGRAVLKP